MTDYKQKYLKYKHNYIEFKQVLHGGAKISNTIYKLKEYIKKNTTENLKKAIEYLAALEIIRNKYSYFNADYGYVSRKFVESWSIEEQQKIENKIVDAYNFISGLERPNVQPDDD